ncbi:MAG: hypothetical protein AAB150_08055, partial [Pseudomonadota bacterium]
AREAAELRAREEAERQAREEAERKEREQAEHQRKEAEEQARRVAEEQARKEAEEAERKAREAAELRAREEAERQARDEAERKEREQAERQRKEAEEQARREAEEQARKDAEEAKRKAREEAERKEREEVERQRKEAEEQARRGAEEQARKDAEEQARKDAEEAERKAREAAELRAKQEAERQAREEAERKEREEVERQRKEAEEHAQREAETRAREQAEKAERTAREVAELGAKAEAERKAHEEAERQRAETGEKARAESAAREREAAEETQRREHEETERKAEEAADRLRQEEKEQAQTPHKSSRSLDDLVKIETDLDAVAGAPAPASPVAAQTRDSLAEKMLKEVEESARRQSEAQAVREAEERARVEEQARADAEAARSSGDETATQPGAADAMDKPDGDYARKHAEAQSLLSAQEAETERHFAEMEKELEAEQGAGIDPKKTRAQREAVRRRDKDDAEARFGAAAEARAVVEQDAIAAEVRQTPLAPVYRTPIKWGRPVALVLFLLLVLAAVTVHFVSFDAYIPRFEKLAGAYLQQPVKIRALHLSLVPLPHWRLEGVSVGNEGQLKVGKVTATAELGSMFSDKMSFALIELESPLLGEQGMTGLLFGRPAGQDFKVVNIVVKNGKLDSNTFVLPALDAKISIAENGSWQKIALETPDHKTSLLFTPEGEGANLEVETNVFSLPFDPSFFLENFSAKGVIRRGELRLSELKGGIYGGFLSGSANLKWNADWSLSGEVSVRTMDPGRFAPALFEEGVLEGKAKYAMRANSYDELFAAPRLEGNFEMRKGALLGVDMGRLLQGGGVGGRTAYVELTGSFVREASKTQLRQIRLSAGPVTAGGSLDTDSGKRINGRFAVELKSPVAQARSNLTLTGTLSDPRFSR